jgi:PPOX class probable F420-dependent enzyme
MTATASLPATHLDLLQRPLPTVLTTQMPDGRLQASVVWCDLDGNDVLINTMREFQKARNLRTRPHATVLITEPDDPTRWIEARARVVPDGRDPMVHLDELTRQYIGTAPYFGWAVPAHLKEIEHPIVYRLIPAVVRTGPMDTDGRRPGRVVIRAQPWPSECHDEPPIPASHQDLLHAPVTAALSTRMPNGTAQTQPVWCTLRGNDIQINTTWQRCEGRNLAEDPRATILSIDPKDSSRWIEIRGDVDLVENGAQHHADQLTRHDTKQRRSDGNISPVEQRTYEALVIATIHPRHVTLDAIHR